MMYQHHIQHNKQHQKEMRDFKLLAPPEHTIKDDDESNSRMHSRHRIDSILNNNRNHHIEEVSKKRQLRRFGKVLCNMIYEMVSIEKDYLPNVLISLKSNVGDQLL